jgi:hypothetical protein
MAGPEEEEDFDDSDDVDEIVDDESLDVDRVFKDLDNAKRRAQNTGGEPAWRRLERRMEQKQTAEQISDFEDYDIGDGGGLPAPRSARSSRAGR